VRGECMYMTFSVRVHMDHGICDLAIIVAPSDQTISCMKASIMCALLNSSHGTHSMIIIARTATGRRLSGPDRRPVGDRAPPRDCAIQHTTHYITPHCLIYTLPTHIFPIQADHDNDGRLLRYILTFCS